MRGRKMATAASKRKQDEKHLKILREMVALAHNKQCFDCHQRGPTYVNMTIGSFICTSCSGILRGLNPPHRVKSISMTSFSSDDMDFLKNRGNEFCKKTWLAGFNPSVHREPDSKDEHKVREYMADKYEKKRYHKEGTEAMHEEARQMNTPPSKPDTKSLRTLTGNSLPALKVQGDQKSTAAAQPQAALAKPTPSQPPPIQVPAPTGQPVAPPAASQPPPVKGPSGFDLLSDLGGDPFAGPPKTAQNTGSGGGGFADFSSFGSAAAAQAPAPASVASPPQTTPTFPTGAGLLQPMSNNQVPTTSSGAFASFSSSASTPSAVPPSAPSQMSASDKYAALASLDNVFGGGGTNAPINWDGSLVGAGGNVGWNSNGSGQPPTSAFGANPGSNSTASFGAQTNSTAQHISSREYLGANENNPFLMGPASNPFGSSPGSFGRQPDSTATTPGGNPFLGGGGAGAAPVTYAVQPGAVQPGAVPFGQFISQATQPSMNVGGFGQFGSGQVNAAPLNSMASGQHQQQQPQQPFGAQNGGFTTNVSMSQGGFGVPRQQAGFVVAPGMQQQQQQQQAQFAGASPMMVQGNQFGAKMVVPSGGQPQQQQFAAWGSAPPQGGNPFMSAASQQQPVPPRASSTNPFL